MNQPDKFDRDEFDRIVQGIHNNSQPAYTDPAPYGPPPSYVYTPPVKTGLTPRGKAAIAIGGVVIASGALFCWQHYTTQKAAAEVRAAEIQLEREKFELEKLKELNKVNAENAKAVTAADKERQEKVDSCIKENKNTVGKQIGATYRSVVEDCQAQYPATTSSGMANTASTTNTTSGSGGADVNNGALIGVGILALGLATLALKSKKPTTD